MHDRFTFQYDLLTRRPAQSKSVLFELSALDDHTDRGRLAIHLVLALRRGVQQCNKAGIGFQHLDQRGNQLLKIAVSYSRRHGGSNLQHGVLHPLRLLLIGHV